jgi:hypothetical protein
MERRGLAHELRDRPADGGACKPEEPASHASSRNGRRGAIFSITAASTSPRNPIGSGPYSRIG